MSNFFKEFVDMIAEFGELQDAHLYTYNYISASVRGNDGKIYDFTINIKEDENDD